MQYLHYFLQFTEIYFGDIFKNVPLKKNTCPKLNSLQIYLITDQARLNQSALQLIGDIFAGLITTFSANQEIS